MLSIWNKNENMKSNQKEKSDDKKQYVFFSNPDIIVKRAETSAVAAQITRDLEAEWQTFEKQPGNLRIVPLGIKSLENLLSYHPVQPYPFTFISAVKQKLALGDQTNISTKAYDPSFQAKNSCLTSSVLKANSTQNLYPIVQKMDFVRPLKVPNLKISPKTLDFSRENSVSKELSSTKSEIAAKELAHDRSDKTLRTGERVQRKLDFSSSDGSSIINCESIEPLKAPNVSIASNLSKKKEHVRDNSREKENRSKRMKKDDSSCTKRDDSVQDQVKRSRSPRHVSRKDTLDMSNIRLPLSKNDRSFHATKSNEFLSTKSKDKNFVMSIAKKDSDKRQKSSNVQSVELTRDNPLESKGRMSTNESLAFSWKGSDKVTLRDNSNIGILSSNTENKSKDICHLKQRPEVEDLKYKSDSDNKQLKQDKSNITHKEKTKRVSDKIKLSNNKIEGKLHSINSELLEDIGSISETNSSNSSKNRTSAYPVNTMQSSKSKDVETIAESKQNINSARSVKTSENLKYTDHSVAQFATVNTKKDEESYSQSIITTKETTTNDDSNDIYVSTLPETLFDPRRISFREGHTQKEFYNLTTPEKMNLVLRSKRRRYWTQSSDSEVDARYPKYKTIVKSEKEQEEIQLMHPTALHMQYQAQLHLYDSFNESIRQVMDVEKCLYDTKCEQKQKNLQKVGEKDEKLVEDEKIVQVRDGSHAVAIDDNEVVEKLTWNQPDYIKTDIAETWKSSDEAHLNREQYVSNQGNLDESVINYGKFNKTVVTVAEVQTQTVNDIATQTDISADKRNVQNRLSEIHEKIYERSFSGENEVAQLSLDSAEQFEDLDQIEEISLPSRIRTMSEISLHETTSSIKTETGTEISISTRDVTCSFNQYLDLEIAQLIRDENQRCNKFQELFKFREKTLDDKTRKLAQLQEQKRVLRDTGQDSRSVRKKQRALVLKLRQEKEEIYKLKKLHEFQSQERKSMLQKQRDMFNLQMSTKNILTKLKRSADSQSPRRLSGPMKGYDIRSNSSMSSLIDSDKSQHDRSQLDIRLQASESDAHSPKLDLVKSNMFLRSAEEYNTSASRFDDLAESKELQEKSSAKSQKKSDMSKYERRSRKYDEKMPRADILRQKQNQLDMESKRIQGHSMKINRLLENQESIGVLQSSRPELDVSAPDCAKSESDTLVEELSKRSKPSQVIGSSVQIATVSKEKELTPNIETANSESINEEINTIVQDTISKTTQSSQVSEDILQTHTNTSKNLKKIDKSVTSNRDVSKKLQHSTELKTNSKRKSSKYQKTKSSSGTLTENILRSKSSSVLGESDLNESQNSLQAFIKNSKAVNDKIFNKKLLSEVISDYESKENVSSRTSNRKFENDENSSKTERGIQNVSASQISTFAISHHSSGESEKNFSKSIVVRSQDRDFEQILTARETALASRKNCVEKCMAWHARLRAEEDRVTRMEQAAFKLVAAASNVLSQQDTTVSSDTSDVEGRIGFLTEKLSERRMEMARLKKEAKKQAKKQLRALEANLMNQIKRYDTTIHEMRKKLESKKAIKEIDKLAIEPRSLADFKVPDIPLKRIQDIYKSSDLLRSRSESDLLSTKNQQKDFFKIVTPITYEDKYERDNSKKSTKTADIKSTNASELKGIADTNHSTQTIFDEYTLTEAYDKVQTVTSTSSASNDARSREIEVEESTVAEKQSNISHDVGDTQMNFSTVGSELEVQTISNTKFEDHNTINTELEDNRLIANIDHSQPKTPTIRSEIQEIEKIDYSKSIPSKFDYSTENAVHFTVADSNTLTYSKKLDFLQLNNKNLSEDISSIENDIKALSEIMSRLSYESNEKSKIDNDERNTSQDISEIISKSVFSDEIANIANERKQTISSEGKNNIDSLSILTHDRKSKSSNDLSHFNYVSDGINSEISAIISGEASSLSNMAHEIDYEAKSKEIMNEIEKSIISEHIKVTCGDYNATSVLENENEGLLNDLVSELNVNSISEILSKVSESRKNLDLATNTAAQIIDDSKKNINEQSNLNEEKLEEDLVKDQTEEIHSLNLSEHFSAKSIHSPIIAGHRSKENHEKNSQNYSQSTCSAVINQISQVLPNENLKSSENISELLESQTSIVDDMKILKNSNKDIQTTILDSTINLTARASNADQNQSRTINAENISQDKDNWTTSDSFEAVQNEISTEEKEESKNSTSLLDHIDDTSNNFSEKNISCINSAIDKETETFISDVDVSAFIPKGESTNIEVYDITFKNALAESRTIKSNDELDDILDIIARENNQKESIPNNESEKLNDIISDSMAELLDKVKDIVENDRKSTDNSLKDILCDLDINADNRTKAIPDTLMLNNRDKDKNKINVEDMREEGITLINTSNNNKSSKHEELMVTSLHRNEAFCKTDDKSAININLCIELGEEESPCKTVSEAQEIIITELDSNSIEDNDLSELEIDAKVELAEEDEPIISHINKDKNYSAMEENEDIMSIEIKPCLEQILEQDSSDGEQLDNLVEVAESGLDTVEKFITPSQDSLKLVTEDAIPMQTEKAMIKEETIINTNKKNDETTISGAPIIEDINKTFDILKDLDYEDISEESLEVSEILDKNDFQKAIIAKKSVNVSEEYQTNKKSEEISSILNESSPDSVSNSHKNEKNVQSIQSATEEISEFLGAEVSAGDDSSSPEINRMMEDKIEEESYRIDESRNRFLEETELQDKQSVKASDMGLSEENQAVSLRLDDHDADDKSSQIIYELRERVSQLQEQDGSSESSEAGDTPRGVSEIEMDSPRDFNDSRLDIDILDDDLLSGSKTANQSIDVKTNFHSASIVATSEKDIETMIEKLKASLEQPGLEVAELEAKLLRIEQLQIELEIKKLEAEEVSYYVREIPNKPPPPYTPPGDGRLLTSLGSPSLVTAVIPSNVEELTSFTEKATALIYNAKLAGEDIASLEAPPEIYELTKDKNETIRRDKRIYNTFLFDLCKETIVEIYRAEYEKPGPSWIKPNVKTKPTMKIPKTVEELIEYVNKEVATLFGFKTKLQRENMVMRWSRKRRDRVDELLAREAQAEEDEWTKFHHDELSVKNGLTIAILDTLLMETANVVKIAYGKKRSIMV